MKRAKQRLTLFEASLNGLSVILFLRLMHFVLGQWMVVHPDLCLSTPFPGSLQRVIERFWFHQYLVLVFVDKAGEF